MGTKIFIILLIVIIYFPIKPAFADSPFASFNNKFGVHILFPEEIQSAAELVNSNGGDWGYVTIPIQAGDKDIVKWQLFMDSAKQNHVIPIIRLATEGDYFNTKVWRKPNETDIIDFANFLNSLSWPIKNKYIVIFNEVNRFDEWGGDVNPSEYAELLNFAVTVFKSKNQAFFIISAGLDNAAPEVPGQYKNQYNYLDEMDKAVPGIFNQIDGLASHSYPNPAFAQPPGAGSRMGINSFDYERKQVKNMSRKDLPVFITETGWSTNAVSDQTAADYYTQAFNTIWSDTGIAAVTPFLLRANGVFAEFSLIAENGIPSARYQMIKSLPKTRGMPVIIKNPPLLLQHIKNVLGLDDSTLSFDKAEAYEYRNFSKKESGARKFSTANLAMMAFRWLIGN